MTQKEDWARVGDISIFLSQWIWAHKWVPAIRELVQGLWEGPNLDLGLRGDSWGK